MPGSERGTDGSLETGRASGSRSGQGGVVEGPERGSGSSEPLLGVSCADSRPGHAAASAGSAPTLEVVSRAGWGNTAPCASHLPVPRKWDHSLRFESSGRTAVCCRSCRQECPTPSVGDPDASFCKTRADPSAKLGLQPGKPAPLTKCLLLLTDHVKTPVYMTTSSGNCSESEQCLSASPGVLGDFPLLLEHCWGAMLADVGGPACRVSDRVPPEGFGAVPTPRAPQALSKGAPCVLSNPLPSWTGISYPK